MNIYEARKSQKKLFKVANKNYRVKREYLWKGQLFYQVISKFVDDYIVFRGDGGTNLERIQQNIKCGLIITFQHFDDDNEFNFPSGMYVLEAIPVDWPIFSSIMIFCYHDFILNENMRIMK